MFTPVTEATTSYMEAMNPASGEGGGSRSFTVRENQPRTRHNPDIDYTKVLIMVGGAIAAGILYDQIQRQRREKPHNRNPQPLFNQG